MGYVQDNAVQEQQRGNPDQLLLQRLRIPVQEKSENHGNQHRPEQAEIHQTPGIQRTTAAAFGNPRQTPRPVNADNLLAAAEIHRAEHAEMGEQLHQLRVTLNTKAFQHQNAVGFGGNGQNICKPGK